MDSGLLRDLEDFLGSSSVLFQAEDVVLYEYDGSVEKGRPDIVVFPTTTQEVSQIVKLTGKHNAPIVGRGAGTGLSGGALARTGGVMIVFARMNRILSLDPQNQRAVVQPGILVGSEGTLALVTEITVKLSRKPEAVETLLAIFDSVDDAAETVVDVTARAIIPAACEMLDGWTLRVVEDFVHAGFPRDSAAVLLLEVEGLAEAVAAQARAIREVSNAHHAREVRLARDNAQPELLWKGRKNAFGALGRLAPSNYVLDGVIPRTKLPQTLRRIRQIGARYGFDICNIFHAGDGNLHPIVLYDPRDRGQFEHAMQASAEIIRYCVEVGGALTGEHGIGMEKSELMPLLFSDADFDLMRRVHDAFNPACLLNPGKIFPGLSKQ